MNDGVMISFLPTNTEWCQQDFPHMTLVYGGAIGDLNPSALNDLAKDAISVANLCRSFQLEVTGVEVFGKDDEKVDVLTLHPSPALLLARKLVERWNASEYKEFNPHATIGPEGSASWSAYPLPTRLHFDRVAVSWGGRNLTFPLAGY